MLEDLRVALQCAKMLDKGVKHEQKLMTRSALKRLSGEKEAIIKEIETSKDPSLQRETERLEQEVKGLRDSKKK